MNQPDRKYIFFTILAIFFAVTFLGDIKVEAQWEAEWQKTLEAGKKEGQVVIYDTILGPALRKQAPIFRDRFGIELEATFGRGSQFAQRLRREKTAGMIFADVIVAGGNSSFNIKRLGVTGPMDSKLILPEVTNSKLWYTLDRLPWLEDAKHFFHFYAYPNRDITVNTQLVKPGDIQSWQDLLKPQFKGRIVWSDPSVMGSGFNGFATNIINKVTDENYYRQLVAAQDITLSRNLRQMAEWLARGKYSVAVSIPGPMIAEMLNAGANIDYVTVKEGTYLSYGGGIVGMTAEAPHPNAAKVFVNWLLSREGQTFAQKATKYMSARNDISIDDVNPQSRRKPGENYFVAANSMEKWVLQEQKKYVQMAKEIFQPLIGR